MWYLELSFGTYDYCVSPTGAKDLIDHLLVVSRRKRYTAKQVMKHPWITSGGGKLKEALPNLQREVSMNLEKNFEGRKSGRRKGGGGVR